MKIRSATEAVLRSITKAPQCLVKEGAVGWGFCHMKGGFYNVKEEDVIRELEKSEKGRKKITWVRGFFRARRFKLKWDEKTKGRGKTKLGALQG